MLKLSPRMFAAAAFCLSTAIVGGEALAQLAPTPAPPRRDTPEKQDEAPSLDSRAGGSLSREPTPGDVPEVDEDVIDEDAVDEDALNEGEDAVVPETPRTRPAPGARVVTGDEEVISGVVADVSENRLTLMVRPSARAPAREVELQVSETAKVTRDGKPSDLMSLIRGDSVRITTAPGDSSVVVRIVATEELKGSVNTLRGNPNVVREGDRPRVRPTGDHEEAVLPLGIEIYAINEAALVTEMLAGGPAENGGVRIGDLIVAINGEPIVDPEGIEETIAESAGGAELTIQRGDQQLTVSLSPARVVRGGLVNTGAIRKSLTPYAAIIGPVDGVGVSVPANGAAGVPAGVVVDPDGAAGPGVVVPNSAPDARRQAEEFEGREPGTNPRSNIDTTRTPGDDPRDAVERGAVGNTPTTGQGGVNQGGAAQDGASQGGTTEGGNQ